jgi:hypothetical protein
MPQRITLAVRISILIILTVDGAYGQNAERRSQGTPLPPDAIADAQTPRIGQSTRPEQHQTPHDRSQVFAAPNALPSSPAFAQQPEKGQIQGFDFFRDPLNAKKPLVTLDEIMKADVDAKPTVMATQRQLLERRYNLKPRLDTGMTMARGKPLVVGPTANLPQGSTWEELAGMTPEEIQKQGIFPYPALPHPKQTPGGQVFPQMQIAVFPRLDRGESGPRDRRGL